jgi:heme exporter protein C
MKSDHVVFPLLLGTTAVVFAVFLAAVFLATPQAQLSAGGLAQKIFYLHVPSAYAMYLAGAVCFGASCAFLMRPTIERDALAQAASECAVAFGCMVLASGPLWAKQAWGVYWTWDPRLTTSLLTVLVYAAVVVLRAFGGSGQAEKKFAAALGVLGTVNLPIIHFSVQAWRGQHPTVIGKGGGGLGDPAMVRSLMLGFLAMTLLAAIFIWSRARLHLLQARVDRATMRAIEAGINLGE